MNWLNLISGPVIGGVIGYFTNYIAVKMLFRPRKAVKLFGHTLPFTPGLIPKRRGDLAKAIAGAIERSLLNKEDLAAMLASDAARNAVAEGLLNAAEDFLRDKSLGEAAGALMGEERLDHALTTARAGISTRVSDRLTEMNIGVTLAGIVGRTVLDKVQGSMLAMFVSPDLVASFTDPMANRINDYILHDGMLQIETTLADELEALMNRPVSDIANLGGMREALHGKICDAYTAFITRHADRLTAHFDIGRTVEDRINAMDIAELETLILSVMKNELNAIVNLGAIIGLVIGVLNSVI